MGEIAINCCDRCGKQLRPDDTKLVTVHYAYYGTIGAMLCPDCCTDMHVFCGLLPAKISSAVAACRLSRFAGAAAAAELR